MSPFGRIVTAPNAHHASGPTRGRHTPAELRSQRRDFAVGRFRRPASDRLSHRPGRRPGARR
jgi:hypothetical protein